MLAFCATVTCRPLGEPAALVKSPGIRVVLARDAASAAVRSAGCEVVTII